MPYYIGRVVDDGKTLVVRSPEAFKKQGIDARVFHRADEIDIQERRVRVEDLKGGRTYWEGFDQLMIATGALFLASLVLSSVATAIRGYGSMILEYLPRAFATAPNMIIFMAPPLLAGVTFLILYRWAPPQPIAWGPAIVGASLGAILWYFAKRLFGWYLVKVARNHLIYGILGSFIGLLLWVYYTSLIFLLGAVVALSCWRTRPNPGKD